jgi:hypothetical protein
MYSLRHTRWDAERAHRSHAHLCTQVSLQDTHLRLLLQLQQAHDRAMSKIPELNQQVRCCWFSPTLHAHVVC